jgi:threonine/homoserine/homoserine lactone efflux protein
MSITRAGGADRRAGFVAAIGLVLPDLLFVLLAVYNASGLPRRTA